MEVVCWIRLDAAVGLLVSIRMNRVSCGADDAKPCQGKRIRRPQINDTVDVTHTHSLAHGYALEIGHGSEIRSATHSVSMM